MQSKRSRPSGDRSKAPGTETHNSVFGKIAFAITLAIPAVLTIAYGGVDVWALIILSLMTMTAVAFWAVDGLKLGHVRISRSALQIPVACLLLIALIQLLPVSNADAPVGQLGISTAALSMDPYATGYFAVRLFFLLIFFAVLLRFLDSDKRLERIAVSVVVFGAVMAFVGILQRLASPDAIYGMRPTPQAIPFGPFVNQHHFAAFMEMTIGPALAILLSGATKPDKKTLYVIALILMSIAVVMTGSRGGLVGTFVVVATVLAVAYFTRTENTRSRPGLGLGIAAGAGATLVLIIVAVLFLGAADPLARGIGLQGDQSDPTSGRMHFWGVAWKIFLDHPVIGAGFDAFGMAFTRYDTWNGFFRVEQAHNDYLQMLADGGVLSFACVIAFILLFVTSASRCIRRSEEKLRAVRIGAFAGCCGILIHSVFDFPLRTPSNSYFFLLLAAFATVELSGVLSSARRVKE